MIEIFNKINVDWMGKRKIFIAVSVILMLAGLASAIFRQATGSSPFNLGVDFKGGTVLTTKFKNKPSDEAIRAALQNAGVTDAVIQESTDKRDEVLIKVPLVGKDAMSSTNTAPIAAQTPTATPASGEAAASPTPAQAKSEVEIGRERVKKALDTFGVEAASDLAAEENAAYKIVKTESVGPVAGEQLRNQAVAVTLLGLLGILFFIAFRYNWTYGAGAVIAVFHDVLVTLAFFSIFQWEIDLAVVAALLTLVGFSVNDSIVIFDRIRENLKLNRREPLYKLTNDAINQTMSRTIITGGLVFLSVLALVLFGGEVLRGFSLALFVGVITGTYSTIAIASPIALWWEQKLNAGAPRPVEPVSTFASSARRGVVRQPKSKASGAAR